MHRRYVSADFVSYFVNYFCFCAGIFVLLLRVTLQCFMPFEIAIGLLPMLENSQIWPSE